MSRNVRIIVVVVAAAAVAIAVIVSVVQGSSGSPLDNSLKASAERLATRLHQSDKAYAQQADFLNAFNLFQHNEGVLLNSGAADLQPAQFAQIDMYETSTMPPVARSLQMPRKPPIAFSGDLIGQVAKGNSVTATVHQGNVAFRAYLMPVSVPPTLAAGGTKEVLEVIQVEQT
jgi:hypothetical protein